MTTSQTGDEITVHQMRPSDTDDLLQFLQKAYSDNPRQSDRSFWTWHFREITSGADENIPVWIAKSGDRIAGQLGAIPVELNINGRQERAIWILDLIVDPDFRRRGIMRLLVNRAEEYCPYMLGVNTNEQHAPVLLQRLGWTIVTKIPRYHNVLFPGHALKDTAGIPPVRFVLNLAFAFKRVSRILDPKVRTIAEFGPEFDDFWLQARSQWKCSISRDRQILDWQFKKQPGKEFDILGYYDGANLLGYAVLFFRTPSRTGFIDKAAISDICYQPTGNKMVVDALLKSALALAIERRSGGLVADALDELIQDRLRHLGFWQVKSGLQLMAKVPKDKDVVCDPSSWFLTRADGDISIFEHANIGLNE